MYSFLLEKSINLAGIAHKTRKRGKISAVTFERFYILKVLFFSTYPHKGESQERDGSSTVQRIMFFITIFLYPIYFMIARLLSYKTTLNFKLVSAGQFYAFTR